MKLTIQRSKWLRGEGGDASCLLRESDGKMCCLGFLALACGFSEQDIFEVGDLSGISNDVLWQPGSDCSIVGAHQFPPDIFDYGGETTPTTCSNLIVTNDNGGMGEPHREAEISRLFKSAGVDVEFVD